jgi:hypothetical protein
VRRLTQAERDTILKDISEGAFLNDSLRQLSLYTWVFYDERRLNPAFEAAFLDAAHRGGNKGVRPIRTATPHVDEENVKRAVLDVLLAQGTLATAYKQVGVTDRTVRRLRMDDPQFDTAVTRAVEARSQRRPVRHCTTPGCGNRHMARGLCIACYEVDRRKRKKSSLTDGVPRVDEDQPSEATSHPAPGGCTVADCPDTRIKAKSLCVRHYYQQYRTGRTTPGPQTYGRTTCTVPGCGRPHRAKGYCTRCYERHVRQRRALIGN